MDDIMSTSFQNAQCSLPSILYNILGQVDDQFMLNLLRKNIMGEKFDQQIKTFFDTDASSEGLSKRLPASNSSIAL